MIEILTTSAMFAVLEPALKVLTDEMFKADWAEAQARVGDNATMDDLIRTDRQRLHDAFVRLLFAGIGNDPSTANVVVNLTVDEETLREEAERRDAAGRRRGTTGPRHVRRRAAGGHPPLRVGVGAGDLTVRRTRLRDRRTHPPVRHEHQDPRLHGVGQDPPVHRGAAPRGS